MTDNVNEKLDALKQHHSELRKDLKIFSDLLIEIKTAIGGNQFNDNKGLVFHQNKLKDEVEKLKRMTEQNSKELKNISRLTWIVISGFISACIYYFTR